MYIEDTVLKYNDLDDDEFHKKCLGENESFEGLLKRIGKLKKQAKQEYSEFMLWLDAMRSRLGLKNMQKTLFCRSLCGELKKEYSKELARLWCMCFSQYSDFLFEKQGDPSDKDDMEYRIGRCALLLTDIDGFMCRLGNESKNRESFLQLRENITYSEEKFLEIDVDDFYIIVTECIGLEGKFLKDNLTYVCDKVSHSKELSQIAPNVFYALLMRYRKKLESTEGFMPNFKSAIRFIEYEINKNNGKNQDIYPVHIVIYNGMCQYFGQCDKEFCDAGFSCMSNLCENDDINWYEFPQLTRPLAAELRDRYFTCFPNGLDDNPVFTANSLSVGDMVAYEDSYEPHTAPKARVICYVRKYLSENIEPPEQYIGLLKNGETEKCMKIIHDIIEKSDVSPEFIKPEMSDVVNAVIMEEVLENVSDRVKAEMLGLLPYLKEMIGKQPRLP